MGIAVILGLSGALAGLQPIPVDFRLEGAAQQAAIFAPPAPAPAPDVGPTSPGLRQSPVRRRVVLANGFGHDVPLEFAVRQVVPPYWHIQYSQRVDQQIRVSWQGGKPWDQVLHTVLEPLGLRMKPSGRTLWIHE